MSETRMPTAAARTDCGSGRTKNAPTATTRPVTPMPLMIAARTMCLLTSEFSGGRRPSAAISSFVRLPLLSQWARCEGAATPVCSRTV